MGGIIQGTETPLLPLQQTLTSPRYVDLVLDAIVRLEKGAAGDNFILMHVDAPPHSSRLSKEFLETERVTVVY